MADTGVKKNPENQKQIVFSSKNPDEGLLDDVSVGSVKSSITKKILVFILGIVFIPLIIYLFSVFILPIFKTASFSGVTLTYWGLWEDKNVMEKVILDFERENPNIKIDYQKQDIKTQGKYVNRLTTRINTQAIPDIFRFHNSWTIQIRDLLLPLSEDVVQSSELSSNYYDFVQKDTNIGGAYYGIPLGIDTLALFVNTRLLSEAGVETPTTWDDLAKAARKLTIRDANSNKMLQAGVALGTYDNIDHASDIISLLMYQNGVNFNDFSATSSRKNISDTLAFYTSFALRGSDVWNNTFENSKLAFAKEKVVMMFGYSWDVFEIKRLNPNIQFGVYPVPHLPGRTTTIASYWVEGISSRTKHPKEALAFLKFLAKKESLEKLYTEQSKTRSFGELYPRPDMAQLVSQDKMASVFTNQAKNAISTPFSSDTYDNALNSSLNGYLANAVNGVLSSTHGAQSSADTLANGVKQVLGRYIAVPN